MNEERKEKEERRKREIPGWKDEFDGRPQLPEESFGEFLEAKAARNRDKPYLYFEDRVVTYGALRDKVSQVANGLLDLGVKKGEHVAIVMYNCPEYLYTIYATNAIAAVHVTINPALKGEGLSYIINQSDSETLVVEQECLENIDLIKPDLKQLKRIIMLGNQDGANLPGGCVPFHKLYQGSTSIPHIYRQPGDLMRIHYTSGTTGLPKGTVTRFAVASNYPRDKAQLKYQHTADEIQYVILPLYHNVGYMDCTARTLNVETSCGLTRRFSARRFWPEVRKFGCTCFSFAGSMPHILLKQPLHPDDKNHSMRFGDGYAPIGEIRDEFYDRFGVILIERYATSDGGGGLRNIPGDKKGSIGRDEGGGRLVTIIDENGEECPPYVIGELVSRPRDGTAATAEYYKEPERTAEKVKGGWFHTGDYGYRDEEGWMFFSDRDRQFIRRRGENISSLEIESVIDKHPDVVESAAVGVSSEFQFDQEIKISVILKPGSKLTPEELIDWCQDKMARFMIPRYVDFRDCLPKTATERVQKHKLVDEGVTPTVWDREKTAA
ncbi:MAG: AMP-binding protein [Dehalococcoidales bacterium]|nr:AMP-binding protein [Dehalococcoidales bacterium]